ncbi:F-box protein 21 [Geosmithia morbida]|uniref:F-box protein 21 n=1 Tax=Geosmithia morbida TaxID=1094350 RepID=A0A9P4YRQ8_9HYPO|nr:F-box protein 21 [Geosmithia morbida]KAF4121530.1 F-box protein 21 [Geosmithia morbida]
MSLAQLPDEIIHHLLYFISPDDTLCRFRLVCRRLAQLSDEPLLWRHYCVNGFRYWHPRHEYAAKLSSPVGKGDWKDLYLARKRTDALISRLFDGILETKVDRLARIGQISELGYQAKDFLMAQRNTPDHVDNVLTRKYFGDTILDSIHRSAGIEQWQALADRTQPDPGLEKVLGGLDMFVLDGDSPDIDDITRMIDDRTAEFLAGHPDLELKTTRQKALLLNRWVRSENLVGLADPQHDYRNLRNCLIGQALRSSEHDSIPIISCAIYTCVARRVGLDAHCCNFPGHIHAVVQAPTGRTLDDEPVSSTLRPLDRMYLDPFGKDDEVPLSHLEALLERYDASHDVHDALSPASSATVLARTGTNIMATYVDVLGRQDIDRGDDDEDGTSHLTRLSRLYHGSGSVNLIKSLYASMWASLVITPPESWAGLDLFLGRFVRSFPEDAWLVERHLVPRAPTRRNTFGRPAGQSDDAWKLLRSIQRADRLPSPVFPRDPLNDTVSYRIGQVFRHTSHGHLGVITGWSNQGTRDLATSNSSAGRSDVGADNVREEASDSDVVNRLRLDSRTYFTYLRTTSAERYVIAEDDIEIITDPDVVDSNLFHYAGKYFKRFNRETCSFVSNNREQFPDD